MAKPLSKVPYLIQGLLDWMSDSGVTPYLVINARLEGVAVPVEFVQADGSITLNISASAVRNLRISADGVFFDSRFKGQPYSIVAPIKAVLGLVSREAGDGLWFPENAPSASLSSDGNAAPGQSPSEGASESRPEAKASKGSHLRVVD
jgi:stringent starvation protein B